MDIKTKVQGVDPNVQPRDIDGISAKAANIYDPVDYKKSPQEYCGMTINDNPYYDLV